MTTDDFLRAIFAETHAGGKVFTASVPGDPTKSREYGFTPFLLPGENWYFCVSTLSDPTHRTPANCTALYVLVVDDVVEKIPPTKVLGILGPPTYVLETSSGSYQWGYKLSPSVTDPARAEGLVRALAHNFTGDMQGRNRLARLPGGINGKPGKQSFPTQIIHWAPQISLSPTQAEQHLEAVPVPPTEASQPFLPPHEDPVLALIPYEETRTPGTYRITCPWVHEHTDQRDDGTAYIAPAGFRCFHGHCSGRTFADLRRHLGLSAETVDDARIEAQFGFKTDQPPAYIDDTPIALEPQTVKHPWYASTFSDLIAEDGSLISRDELSNLYPRKWLFHNTIPMGVPWGIAGEGGLGKSRMALAMCMSIASGVPLGDDLVPAIEAGAPCIFLTQEDSRPDRAWRALTQLEYMAEKDERWADPQTRRRIRENLFVPQLPFGQTLNKAFRDGVGSFLRDIGPVRLMVFDPLILFWAHDDEDTNINSARGTINTFQRMIATARHPDRPTDDEWSIGLMHHLAKSGEVYGSAMIQAHLRTLFGLTRIPDGLQLEVLKVNGSNILGRKWCWSMEKITGAVFPDRAFGDLSDDEKVARALHAKLLVWDQTPSKIAKDAAALRMFGPEPDKFVKRVLASWKEKNVEHLGLTKEPYGRYKPIEGWQLTGEEEAA